MPELPEVEVVRSGLERWVVGRPITQVDVYNPRAIRRHTAGPLHFADVLRERFPALTAREAGVLALIAEGRSNAEIAASLYLGVPTVKSHINALFAKNFDQISWFPTFVLTPLTYLGGVFYSVTMLPNWAHVASNANPILYMVSAFRFGFLGTSDVDLRLAYAIMISAAAAMFALAVTLLNRGTGIRE